MSIKKIELCNGAIASFDEDKNIYLGYIPWNDDYIEVELSSDEYNENKIEGLKRAFETFWNERERFVEEGKRDIKEKLLPYTIKHNSLTEIKLYPDVSIDAFDADYQLTGIVILFTFYSEVQILFNKADDLERYDELNVMRDLESGYISFEAGGMPVLNEDLNS